MNPINNLDKQGHRGSRSTHPENTIEGMRFALDQGVTTLEMDLVITKDRKVILSHEPWFNEEICFDETGKNIHKSSAFTNNIYLLNYEDVIKFDCGSKPHPRFPDQHLQQSSKPLLETIITQSDAYAALTNRPLPYYNIEIKYVKETADIFHPEFDIYTDLVYEVIQKCGITERTTIQSFDFSVLQYCKTTYPNVKLSLLIENHLTFEENLNNLGFNPDIYSCYYKHVNLDLINECHRKNIRIIPWTINDLNEIKYFINMGVDGIITDYPQLFNQL